MASASGLTIFREKTSGASLSIDRDPQLQNRFRNRSQLDRIVSDAGIENYFTRKVKTKVLDLVFPKLTYQQSADLSKFFIDIVNESELEFCMESTPLSPDFFKVGQTVNGAPLVFGDTLPDGSVLTVGRRYRLMDRVENRFRFILGSFQSTDENENDQLAVREGHTTVSFSVIQVDP